MSNGPNVFSRNGRTDGHTDHHRKPAVFGVLTPVDKSLNMFVTVARICMASYEKCLQSSLGPTFFLLVDAMSFKDYVSKMISLIVLVGDLVYQSKQDQRREFHIYGFGES